jgi:YD repeat-containing protein
VNSSNAATFGYDPVSLLTSAGSMTMTRHAQNGLLTGTTLGAISDSRGYNGFGELVNYNAADGSGSVYAAQYTRDPLGRISTRDEAVTGSVATFSYDYDLGGRLSAVRRDGTLVSQYTYDAHGNRVGGFTPAGTILSATYDEHDRLLEYTTTTGTRSYTYTLNGTLRTKTVNGETTTYTHDALGNLIGVQLPDGRQIEYLYDTDWRASR